MASRVLVTGGAGFIGSHLVRSLLAAGHEVVVLDDLSMGKRENVPAEATFIQGDIRSASDVRQSLEGVETVFHEAARVSIRASVKQFVEDAEINLMGTLNILQCCADTGVRKLVYASSMAVYDDSPRPMPIAETYRTEPQSPYGISKLAGEKYCLQFCQTNNVQCRVLRYFNTYGPGQTFTPYVGVITIFINGLLRGQAPTIFGDGEQRRDFVHVSDIVQANLCALKSDRPSGIYNVGTGRATSVNEIAAMLCERINPKLKPNYAPAQIGELRNSIADVTRISQELGYQPRVEIADRIGEVIESCREKLEGS
jgi:UDP-glucose 4-epimerase